MLNVSILCRRFFCFLLYAFSFSLATTHAAEPEVVIRIDRHLWAEKINTQSGFDRASRAMQLLYAHNLQVMKSKPDAELMAAFKIKSINRASVDKWVNAELGFTFNNYLQASKVCDLADWTCVADIASVEALIGKAKLWLSKIPDTHRLWFENSDVFTRTYIGEQMRLAALFPKVTSEIDTFGAVEWLGTGVADKEFFLTFDDGPTKPHGASDETLAMLKEQKKSAAFFVLGNNLQNRIASAGVPDTKKFYADQCIALHGFEHQSHANWEQWQDSITKTKKLVETIAGKTNQLALFRPPYGQRKNDSAEFFYAQHLKVALWNIDSQDWNANVDAEAVVNRVVALMLIKRHGVILFHDIHPKAKVALPIIFEQLGDAVLWNDCSLLAKL